MSDADVVLLLEKMEELLRQEPFPLEPEAIATWRVRFDEAVGSAERGPEWAAITARAHGVGRRVVEVVSDLQLQRDELKRQIDLQTLGERALKGYKPPS